MQIDFLYFSSFSPSLNQARIISERKEKIEEIYEKNQNSLMLRLNEVHQFFLNNQKFPTEIVNLINGYGFPAPDNISIESPSPLISPKSPQLFSESSSSSSSDPLNVLTQEQRASEAKKRNRSESHEEVDADFFEKENREVRAKIEDSL